MELMIWLGVLIIAIIVEVITMGLTTIWFAGGALVAGIAAALHAPVAVQIILFLLVSIALLVFTRPIAVKYFNKDRSKTNVEGIVGKQAIVTAKINNLKGIGQVTVGGQEWSAKSFDDQETFSEGSVVDIVAVAGVKLVVSASKLYQEIEEPKTVTAND